MKTRIAYVLFALTVVAAAGFAWAGQPTTPAENRAESPEVSAPADGAGIVPAEIEGLFVEPVETTGACCVADCDTAFNACRAACGLDYACWAQCQAEHQVCLSYC